MKGDLVKIQLFEGMTPIWVRVTWWYYDDDQDERIFVGDILKIDPELLEFNLDNLLMWEHYPNVANIPTEGCLIEFTVLDIVELHQSVVNDNFYRPVATSYILSSLGLT